VATICTMKKIIAGALLWGGPAVAGVGLAAGTAQADNPIGAQRTVGARGNPYRRPVIMSPTHFVAGT
jgi:hypothetical protein